MSYDNRQFIVNGEMENREQFNRALQLVVDQESDGRGSIPRFKICEKKGFVLYWTKSEGQEFPFGNTVEAAADYIWAWLKSSPKVPLGEWEDDCDHDGHNDIGWKIYTEDWGHVEGHGYAFAAIKPVYLWYGK